jgi:hypothetical protein
MRKYIVLVCIVWGTIPCVKAQLAPKYSNEFLSLGVGARSAGMGGAMVASVNDVTSGYWNPAGLTQIKDNIQLSLMHNEQFAGIGKHDYGAVSFKLDDKSALALSMIRYGVDDIPNTLNLFQNGQIDYSQISSFSSVDYAFIGSYARKTAIEGLSVGANAKVIRRVIGDFANAWGFGFDVGAQYRYHGWLLGAMVRDITSTFNVWSYTFTDAQKQILVTSGNQLPSNTLELTVPKIIIGAARKFQFFHNKFSVMPEVNFDVTTDGRRNVLINSRYINLDPKIGLEAGYADMIFLRGGLNNFQQVKQIDGSTSTSYVPAIGIGLRLTNFMIDYALANGGVSTNLPYSNIISIRLQINRKS